ncbi:MAG: hypothetical protein SLRJCFUN_001761 [Candidatus Fervidibacter sp.]
MAKFCKNRRGNFAILSENLKSNVKTFWKFFEETCQEFQEISGYLVARVSEIFVSREHLTEGAISHNRTVNFLSVVRGRLYGQEVTSLV